MVVSTTSSNDEENALKHLKKVRKKNHKICYMHLTAVRNEEVNDFTLPRWNTYRNCVQRWLCCHGEGQKVAETFKHCIDVGYENVPEDAGFHLTCYRRFIDKRRLYFAEKRAKRLAGFQDAQGGESVSSDNVSASGSTIDTPRKKLRSKTGLPIVSAGPLLPALCIICKKTDKIITVGGKRQKDRLSQAETFSAGKHTHSTHS